MTSTTTTETDEETGRKSHLPAWAKFPKWTPAALIVTAWVLVALTVTAAATLTAKAFLALHGSSLPWWAIFFVYAFAGGAVFRAAKEFTAWVSMVKSRWGVFTRWAKALV
ncbi:MULTISPECIES: hypothetical protein [unclassified Streptomyces]|uniref:hypothetical protein n=1 Tax=unclassified Streptomyces TaxID=2593676 RepID=UPI00381A8C8F